MYLCTYLCLYTIVLDEEDVLGNDAPVATGCNASLGRNLIGPRRTPPAAYLGSPLST